MFKASGGFYKTKALRCTLNQGRSRRRTKKTQWKRSPSHVQRFYRFFKISKELYFPHFTDGVESSGSKVFLWLQKWCSKYLGASTTSGFYNARWIKILEGVERKIRKENFFFLFFKFHHPLAPQSSFDPLYFGVWDGSMTVSSICPVETLQSFSEQKVFAWHFWDQGAIK